MICSGLTKLAALLAPALALACIPSAPTSPAGASAGPALTERWARVVGARPQYVLADGAGVIAITAAGRVTSFSPAGGRRWVTSLALGPDEGVGTGRAALGRDVVAVPIDESRVVALDRATGTRRWSAALPTVRATVAGTDGAGASFVVASDRLGRLVALDGRTGEVRWSLDLADWVPDGSALPTMWVRAGRLVVNWVTDGKGCRLLVADTATGTIAWQRDAPNWSAIPAVTARTITLAENLEVRGSHIVSGAVTSLDLATGATRWSRAERPDGAYLPELASAAGSGRVAVLDYHGTLHAFSLRDGRPLWTRETSRRQLAATPVVVGQVLALTVLGSEELAVGMRSGAPGEVDGLGGPQTTVTIDAAAATSRRLYLLVHDNADGAGEVRAFEAAS